MSSLNIGVVGYSDSDFNTSKAVVQLEKAFDEVVEDHSGTPRIVSGLTALDIPKLAYQEADSRGWGTVGIACEKAFDFDLYPVDEQVIVGDEWGDESPRFLEEIDVLIRVGGGDQAHEECSEAKNRGIPTYEYKI